MTGIDAVRDLLEVALKFDYIKRLTTQKYALLNLETGEIYKDAEGNDLVFVGKQKLIDYLNSFENRDFLNMYVKMLHKFIVASNDISVNILDDAMSKSIIEEEENL